MGCSGRNSTSDVRACKAIIGATHLPLVFTFTQLSPVAPKATASTMATPQKNCLVRL